jgi:hypothetical protein
MKPLALLFLLALPLLALSMLAPLGPPTPRSARSMNSAASRFLLSLTPLQRERANLPFLGDERENWHFVPIERRGLPLSAMDTGQRALAVALLKTALSKGGVQKAETIMALEDVLKAIEKGSGPVRDRDAYFVTVFGTPDSTSVWGWRIEGHHFSLNVTVQGEQVSSTPIFFGSNPAEVRIEHPMKSVKVLKAEEEAARVFLSSLNDAQRAMAIIDKTAPNDIFSHEKRQIVPLDSNGLSTRSLNKSQTALLRKLIGVYSGSMAPELAKARLSKMEAAGWDKLVFAWAGSEARGEKHYYRIQGPTLLIEYDNTQNDANHVHSVWRDFTGDFGRDLLGEHVAESHTSP